MKASPLLHVPATMLLSLFLFSCSKQDLPAPQLQNTVAATNTTAAVTVASNSWMTALADNTNIAAISIPGTHDSGARVEPVSGTAKCQDLSIADQLEAGIRYLDIRCRHIDNAFAIHHGAIYQNLNFDDVLTACKTFLSNHPKEVIVMCVKEEYDASNNTRTFEQTFDTYVSKYGNISLTATVPNLGDVRGKIVLLRRFSATTTPKGIDATSWADNTTFTINNGNASLKIQDNYIVNDNSSKWNNVTAMWTESSSSINSTLYINYTSGYKPLIFGIPGITSVSGTINPQIQTYFSTHTSGRYGIVPMDFANSTRSTAILNTNF
ncbi:phosphatidylinositol-specific phospholipase C [Chitinophaga sancti]|uniref:1-phosphatidylinositol phosphodiesterase n=1 Tax=Chitinophaga sancti TaxID=1004 RepID=A0A1K1MLU6_9BACT|nr:phosphatidylinositol-specific phospholipase C [Chitinophaga sancti]WQD62716.1 phosphatidylinositol-specific phospholipase C [Chitinophaga sancti]WQG91660.1 phosphatidylinositol-specific phospholipase C [Chitinophaga sancti]SFW22894.1 1-phosphatidylinositol phosphodiesterase [Chitinophaga sancti]